jgi:hypothetical protein
MFLTHQYMNGLIDPDTAGGFPFQFVYTTTARSIPGAIWSPSGGLPTSCSPVGPAVQPYTFVLLFCSQSTAGVVGSGPILPNGSTWFFPPIVGAQAFPVSFPNAYNVAVVGGPAGGPTLPTFVELTVLGRQLTSQNAQYFTPFKFTWSASAEYLRSQWLARGGAYTVGGVTGTAIPLLNPCNHTVI